MTDDTGDRAMLPFEGEGDRVIRRQWHDGRWFFSVVDVIAVLTNSDAPSNYWNMMKKRLADDEGFSEVYTKCVKLKMRSLIDGKKYPTDAADTETMLRLVQSVPSPKAEPIKQWLAREGARKLEEVAAELDEGQRRLLLRGEVATQNTSLNDAAKGAGVLSSRDFALFHDSGYKGLYAGEGAADIAARKGVAKGRILDHMGSAELAANLFRITLTEQKLTNDPTIDTKSKANKAHHDVGAAVRGVILEQGGTPPEKLKTPEHSIQELERQEEQRIQRELQPPLFASSTETTETEEE
jgi:DNA-damage-inducible protein D